MNDDMAPQLRQIGEKLAQVRERVASVEADSPDDARVRDALENAIAALDEVQRSIEARATDA